MKEFVFVVLVCAAAIGGFLGLALPLVSFVSGMKCHDVARQSGHETKYSWRSGCYIRVSGEWMPLDRYNNVRVVE